MAKAAAKAPEENGLGYYKGLPILEQKIVINKTGDGLSQAMQIAPFDVEPGGEIYLAVHVKRKGERFNELYTKDEEPTLKGFSRVIYFDALGAVPDDRAESVERVADMAQKIADRADLEAANKAGQLRIPDGDGKVRQLHPPVE